MPAASTGPSAQPGDLAQRGPTGLRQPAPAPGRASSAFDRLAGLARRRRDRPAAAESSQASASRAHRSATGAALQMSKASVGSQTASPSTPVPTATRSAASAISTCSAAARSSMCSSSAVAFRSRTPRPPARSADGGRCPSAPAAARRAGPARTRPRRPPGRPARGVAGRRRELRDPVGGRPGGAAPAQADRHLAGDGDVPAVAGHQQAAGEQLVDGAAAAAARGGALGRLDRAVLALALEVLEDRAGLVVHLGDQAGDRGRVGEVRGDRLDVVVPVAGGGQPRGRGPARGPGPGRSRPAAPRAAGRAR